MTMNYFNSINRVSFYNFHAPIGVGKFANFVHTYFSINVRGWEMSKTFVMFVTVFQNQNFLKSWTDTVLYVPPIYVMHRSTFVVSVYITDQTITKDVRHSLVASLTENRKWRCKIPIVLRYTQYHGILHILRSIYE